jgi:hypothetical protein
MEKLANVAELEASMSSDRTKTALGAPKAPGVLRCRATRRAAKAAHAASLKPILARLGFRSLNSIARCRTHSNTRRRRQLDADRRLSH